jgi:hypothetical protein
MDAIEGTFAASQCVTYLPDRGSQNEFVGSKGIGVVWAEWGAHPPHSKVKQLGVVVHEELVWVWPQCD